MPNSLPPPPDGALVFGGVLVEGADDVVPLPAPLLADALGALAPEAELPVDAPDPLEVDEPSDGVDPAGSIPSSFSCCCCCCCVAAARA